MTPQEFTAALADVMNVASTELSTVDRAMAKRGLRRLARGRARPDITLEEGLQIACGWAGSESLTLAADEVERLQSFFLVTESSSTIERDMAAVFSSDVAGMNGRNFLDVAAIAARQLGTGACRASNLRIAVERGGGVDLGCFLDGRSIRFQFVPGRPSLFSPRPNVVVTVTIRGPVLKWIYDVTEGA